MTGAELEALLAEELPITQHLGIQVEHLDAEGLTLRLPLAANRNHKGAAFAGSLNAVATLAAWGVLVATLTRSEVDAHVVVQDSSIRYLKPVRGDALAFCPAPKPAELRKALAVFAKRGRARIPFEVSITDAGEAAALYQGRYVMHRRGA
ncbi:MAG: DUF4442 domain-containing protein [Gemmatimonadales bacterium]|nr:DUF4442 domain-containing protein [Gemmatimonadales bacterium]